MSEHEIKIMYLLYRVYLVKEGGKQSTYLQRAQRGQILNEVSVIQFFST